jgi:hypothetical protein
MGESTSHAHTTEERVSRLEATVETFVLTVSKDIQDQNSNINALRKAIQEQGTPKWQNYIASAAVLLAVVGLIGNAYVRDLDRAETDIALLNAWKDTYTVQDTKEVTEHDMRLKSLERDVYYRGKDDTKPWEDS